MALAPAVVEDLVASVTTLHTRVKALQDALNKLKKMNDGTIIKVAFAEFISSESFAAWRKLNCTLLDILGHAISIDVHLCFLDTLGLMTMGFGTYDVVTSDLDEMSFSYRAKQTGYATLEAAVLFQSIGNRLPLMFGKFTSNTSERILPACLMFPSWDNQD